MQNQRTTGTNKWNTRDFITLAIFNIVMIIILMIITTLTSALSYLVSSGIAALANGPIYIVMSNKINKKGVLFFSSIILGLFFLAFGFLYYLITMAVIGILCELVMWGNNSYKNTFRNAVGYSIYYVGYCLCGVTPLIFFRERYITTLKESYSPEQLDTMLHYFGTPSLVVSMCIITVIGAFAGCIIGSLLLRKHVKKAKLV